jgi:general secretion pathway protein K
MKHVQPSPISSPSRGGVGWGWVTPDAKLHPHPSLPLEGEGVVLRKLQPLNFLADKNAICHQHGAALIVALLATALATLLATRVLETTDATLGYVEGRALHAQAAELTRGGVDYARAILFEDARRSSIDHLGEAWATPLPPVEAEAGRISGRIEDFQGRWNLNQLRDSTGTINPEALATYRRLLQAISLEPRLANALTEYLRPPGATAEKPGPTIPPLSDLATLLEIPGYTATTVERLRPYVSALPFSAPVNVNTAPAMVLAAMIPGMDIAEAQRLVTRRQSLPFRDATEFRGELSSSLSAAATSVSFGTNSQFFIVRANASVGRAVVRQEALLQRQGNGRWPTVVWRHFL